MTWIILASIAVLGLFIYWRGPNAVWGAVTIGLIAGLIATAFYGFHWWVVGKWIVALTICGFAVELIAKFFRRPN